MAGGPTITVTEQHDAQGDLLYAFTLHGATHSRRALDDLAEVVHARTVWAVAHDQHAPDDHHPEGADDTMADTETRYEPADPGDFRFDITELAEPELGATHLVLTIDDQGAVVGRDITDNPYGMVEAAREAQAFTLEERFNLYAERGW